MNIFLKLLIGLLISLMQQTWAADIPSTDPLQQLLGEDKNNNGVRDDFEELILNSELSERAKQHALQAARAYGHALTLHMTGEAISHAQAHQVMQHLIFA